MIVRTEAVILRGMKYRETSKILTLYTQQFGKLSVLAKGARSRKNRFGSALEPMNHVLAVLYKKEHRDLSLLSQCDLMKSHRNLTEDVEAMAAGMSVIEMVNAVTHPEEAHEGMFRALIDALDSLERGGGEPSNVMFGFEMRLCDLLGFSPDFDKCVKCRTPLDASSVGPAGAALRLSFGGALCARCSPHVPAEGSISLQGLRVLQQLQHTESFAETARMMMAAGLRTEVGRTLRRYLQSHVGGLEKLKSEKVFAAIL